jgi:hypothetical protein
VVLVVDGAATPRPVRFTNCGLPPALSKKATVPVVAPTAVGEKLTATAQLDPGATASEQLDSIVKLELTVMPKKFRASLPVFVT